MGSTRSAEVVVLHHLLGLTPGVLALGAHLRTLGAEVRTPDLFDGVVHDHPAAGAAHLEAVGLATLLARADVALGDLGAGAVLVGACLPPDAFAPGWPAATAIRIHAAVDDPLFRDEGDAEAAAALVAAASDATLRLHGGSGHLLVEDGHPDHDADASAAVVADVVALLDASSWSGPA